MALTDTGTPGEPVEAFALAIENIIERYGLWVEMRDAAKLAGYRREKTFRDDVTSGRFPTPDAPIRPQKMGGRWRLPTAQIVRAGLGLSPVPPEGT